VQQLARDKLQMRQVTPAITSYVSYSAPAVPASTEVLPALKGRE
jgi:hypothetical protein